jgi:hypothetical protein
LELHPDVEYSRVERSGRAAREAAVAKTQARPGRRR